jgi:tetratricopeptide (TPR) repeat protein
VETEEMDSTTRHHRHSAAFALAIVAASGLAFATPAWSQQAPAERYRVLVPAFRGENGAKANFGKDVAEEVRKRIGQLPTHQTYAGKELNENLRKMGIKEDTLSNCVTARQFASQYDIPLVTCGTYVPDGAGFKITSSVISPKAGEEFQIPPFTSTDPKQAADQIVTTFVRYTDVISNARYCAEYVASQQWADAIATCDKALAITPDSRTALFYKAFALYKTEKKAESLALLEKVLELDPLNNDALKLAGVIAAEVEKFDVSRKHFKTYLELNPGDAAVRMTIAGDMAKAGDFEGALAVVEEGLPAGKEPDLELAEYAGSLALQAAEKAKQAQTPASGDLGAARPLYEKALKYYEPIYAAKGAQTDAGIQKNMLIVYFTLGRTQEAAAFAEKITAAHSNDATVWQIYAQVLKEQNRADDALAALDKALAADPNAKVYLFKTLWSLETGKPLAEVKESARKAVDRGELDTDQIADLLTITHGYNAYVANNKNEFAKAHQVYDVASEFAQSPRSKAIVSFYRGITLLGQAQPIVGGDTKAAGRQSLPLLQRAQTHLVNAAEFKEVETQRRAYLDALPGFIKRAEALIARGK